MSRLRQALPDPFSVVVGTTILALLGLMVWLTYLKQDNTSQQLQDVGCKPSTQAQAHYTAHVVLDQAGRVWLCPYWRDHE